MVLGLWVPFYFIFVLMQQGPEGTQLCLCKYVGILESTAEEEPPLCISINQSEEKSGLLV